MHSFVKDRRHVDHFFAAQYQTWCSVCRQKVDGLYPFSDHMLKGQSQTAGLLPKRFLLNTSLYASYVLYLTVVPDELKVKDSCSIDFRAHGQSSKSNC